MDQNASRYLHGCKMAIEELEYQILKDAAQEDLLPTALISKYDVTLERLLHVLRLLLDEGYLTLTDGKWIKITEKGKRSVEEKEKEQIKKIEEWKSSYIDEFFSRSNTIDVNEPCLPSIDSIKRIMEGGGLRETSN